MEYKKYQQFNLTDNRPNVLLLGNGILKSCAPTSVKSWEDYIFDIANKPYTDEAKAQLKNAPYSIQAMTVSDVDDKYRQQQYIDHFPTLALYDNSLLKNLLACPFDAILTTNYSYEIENVFLKTYSELKSKLPYVYCTKQKRDYKRLLHTYNQIGNSPPIWHIHGELRVKSSIVLTHDEYSRLICDILNYNKNNQNRYQNYEKDLKFYSWIDYLIMGNVCVVGQGLDFSEFDLWWLLCRKKRENACCGDLHFYAPITSDPKEASVSYTLKELGFYTHSFNIRIPENASENATAYRKFYETAIESINDLIKSSRKELL